MMLPAVMSALLALAAQAPTAAPDYPFGVGERLEYTAKLGLLKLGEASLQVVEIDTVRQQPTFLFRMRLEGGNFIFKINNTLESWTTIDGFRSLRFRKDERENDNARQSAFEIFPDSGFFRESGHTDTSPTPAQPLDDAAFLYFIRTMPLEVGKTYRFDKYYRQDQNPLVVKVLKSERMSLPDGTDVECLVLNPVIGERGMFADRAEARLWLTTDARHLPVQIRSRYPWGTVTLRLDRVVSSPGD
jgi:Protein of unknown function (DUF3108)